MIGFCYLISKTNIGYVTGMLVSLHVLLEMSQA